MHEFHAPYGVYRDTAGEPFTMGDDAKRLRRFFEDYFIEHGYGPDMTDITTALGLSQHDTWEALYQLERGVQVMFLPGTETLVKMPPFSYAPTRHRVSVGDHRRWYAGCAGESCAINALFPGRQVTVTSTCPECWQPMTFVFLDRELVSVQDVFELVGWRHSSGFTYPWPWSARGDWPHERSCCSRRLAT